MAPAPPNEVEQPPPVGAIVRPAILLLAIPAAIFAAVVVYASRQHPARPGPPPGAPGALVWADGQVTFANAKQVAAWERLHGGTFESFKKNHPAALQLVTRPARTTHRKVAASKTAPTPAKKTTTTRAGGVAVPTTNNGGGFRHDRVGIGALAAIGGLLLLLALAPASLLLRLRLRRLQETPELRIVSAAAAAAIAAGLAVALVF